MTFGFILGRSSSDSIPLCPALGSLPGCSSSDSNLDCPGCPVGAASRRFTRRRKNFAMSVTKSEANHADLEHAVQKSNSTYILKKK